MTHSNTEVAKKYTHLYYLRNRCWDMHLCDEDDEGCNVVRSYPVTRTTAKRIYFYDSGWDTERFISRAAIEPTGESYHREVRERLYLAAPELPKYAPAKSVAELRREVADLHPDRGGDPAAFRDAHTRYMKAKAATRW